MPSRPHTFLRTRRPQRPVPQHQFMQKLSQSPKVNLQRAGNVRIRKTEKSPEAMVFIYRTAGTYLGFISSGSIFSRDGEYLGWIEGQFAWDKDGRFRGSIWQEKYIIVNRFAVPPVPRAPRTAPVPSPALPNPPPNIPAVPLPTGWIDAF